MADIDLVRRVRELPVAGDDVLDEILGRDLRFERRADERQIGLVLLRQRDVGPELPEHRLLELERESCLRGVDELVGRLHAHRRRLRHLIRNRVLLVGALQAEVDLPAPSGRHLAAEPYRSGDLVLCNRGIRKDRDGIVDRVPLVVAARREDQRLLGAGAARLALRRAAIRLRAREIRVQMNRDL